MWLELATNKCCFQFKWKTYHWTHHMVKQANTQSSLKWWEKWTEILLSTDCEQRLQLGKRMSNLRLTRKDSQLIHYAWTCRNTWMRLGYRIPPADRPAIGTPPSWDLEDFIEANYVFSRYAFAYQVFNPRAVNTAKVIIDVLNRHAYQLTLMITDECSILPQIWYTK